jgi:deazaflavin-dependent oxidoreductase (nitroreductase family)
MATNWNQAIIDEFRANEGRVGGRFEGRPILLLHHTGAKTGTERVNPLAYQQLEDGTWAVFASKGGAPTNPDWFHNVKANPTRSRASPRARNATASGPARRSSCRGSPTTR